MSESGQTDLALRQELEDLSARLQSLKSAYLLQSERLMQVIGQVKSLQQEMALRIEATWCLRQLLSDLPEDHNWLDADVERMATLVLTNIDILKPPKHALPGYDEEQLCDCDACVRMRGKDLYLVL